MACRDEFGQPVLNEASDSVRCWLRSIRFQTLDCDSCTPEPWTYLPNLHDVIIRNLICKLKQTHLATSPRSLPGVGSDMSFLSSVCSCFRPNLSEDDAVNLTVNQTYLAEPKKQFGPVNALDDNLGDCNSLASIGSPVVALRVRCDRLTLSRISELTEESECYSPRLDYADELFQYFNDSTVRVEYQRNSLPYRRNRAKELGRKQRSSWPESCLHLLKRHDFAFARISEEPYMSLACKVEWLCCEETVAYTNQLESELNEVHFVFSIQHLCIVTLIACSTDWFRGCSSLIDWAYFLKPFSLLIIAFLFPSRF